MGGGPAVSQPFAPMYWKSGAAGIASLASVIRGINMPCSAWCKAAAAEAAQETELS